jgi:hypothetical protein
MGVFFPKAFLPQRPSVKSVKSRSRAQLPNFLHPCQSTAFWRMVANSNGGILSRLAIDKAHATDRLKFVPVAR